MAIHRLSLPTPVFHSFTAQLWLERTLLSLLVLILSDDWDGGELAIWDANQNYGVLSGGSQLPAAGDMAIVWPVEEAEEVDGQ